MGDNNTNNTDIGEILKKVLEPFEDPANNSEKIAKIIALLSSFTTLVIIFIIYVYIAVNICCRGKIKVSYYWIFLSLTTVQLLYLTTESVYWSLEIFQPWMKEMNVVMTNVVIFVNPVSRSLIGMYFLLVANCNLERFLVTTVDSKIMRTISILLSLVISISGPVLVITFYILNFRVKDRIDLNWHQLWFGVEICVYIIIPLLILTIFGTVNYCKVSLTSRLLPTNQIQAVKLNIGVTVTTNIAIFLFLVQECLQLWLHQLRDKDDEGESVDGDEVFTLIEIVQIFVRTSLVLVTSLGSLLFCCISSHCCRDCCCPNINQLEETRYIRVEKDITTTK